MALSFALENMQQIPISVFDTLIRLANALSKSAQSLDQYNSDTLAQLAWTGLDQSNEIALISLRTLGNVTNADKCNIS